MDNIEGRMEGKMEVAKNMLLPGIEIETIARVTGLAPDNIMSSTKSRRLS